MPSFAVEHPFPHIADRAMYERIFLHKSLGRAPIQTEDGPDDDDNERLAFLGDQVLHLICAELLFKRFPVDKTGQLSPRKAYLVSKRQIARWSEEYELPRLIRAPEHQLLIIQHNEKHKAHVFQAYIAALFLQVGYLQTMAWMAPLVEATYDIMLTETEEDEVERALDDESDGTAATSPPQSMGSLPSSPQTTLPSTPRRPSAAPSTSSSRSPPPPSPGNALAAFNQLCSQRKVQPEWTELILGTAHQRVFTMTVKLKEDAGVRGKGTASTKRAAQQLAADEALSKMTMSLTQGIRPLIKGIVRASGWNANKMSAPLSQKHPLPPIINETLRVQVFTHKSIVGAPAGRAIDSEPAIDNERLAFLGDSVINMLVTCAIEANKPLSRRGDLDRTRQKLVVRDRIEAWSDSYDLPRRLIVHKAQKALIPGNPAAKAQVFQAYVGALFKDGGYSLVEDWFIPVVDDALCEIQEFEVHDLLLDAALEDSSESKAWRKENKESPEVRTFAEPVLPIACPQKPGDTPRAPDKPSETGQIRTSDLAFFNETCAKKRTTPNWQWTQKGPGHEPEFTATVTLAGDVHPVGIGIGTTRKLAQQQAARVALSTLEWI